MRVRELMNRNVITITDAASCRAAIAKMHRARVRHLPVLARDGSLTGVVTDRDVRHYLFSPDVYREIGGAPIDAVLEAVTVGRIMSSPAITVRPDDEVFAAAGSMRRHKVGSMPVTEGGRLVGIITETDLLRAICRADLECAPEITEVVVSYP